MRKYISAFLINALLIQFVGCYTQSSITYDEFYYSPHQEKVVVVTKDNKKINLESDSLNKDYSSWKIGKDTLKIFTKHKINEGNNLIEVKTDTLYLSKNEIQRIITEGSDAVPIFFTAIIILVVIGVLIGISELNLGISFLP